MRIPAELLKLIRKNKKFLITGHVNPEGDSIGSCLALALGLKKMKKTVCVLSKDPVPDILKFLPCSDLIKNRIPAGNFDVLFLVDCNTIERTGFENLRAKTTAIIDHHLTRKKHLRDIAWIVPEAAAAGELVYKLLKALNIPIDKKISTNIFTAVFTDTGGFRYSNTTPDSMKIACELIKAGTNPWDVTKEVYENISFNRLRLLTMSLSTLEKRDDIVWMTVTRRMLKNTNTSAQDTESFVDYPRKVKGIEVAVLFREKNNTLYKASLRSKGKVNVANIARIFGGGGHARAAGCEINGSLSDAKQKILKAVRNEIKAQN
jgi:phosphoesterase RecJ-like protein